MAVSGSTASVSVVGKGSAVVKEVDEGVHTVSNAWPSAAETLSPSSIKDGGSAMESVEVETARWMRAAIRSIISVPPGFVDA